MRGGIRALSDALASSYLSGVALRYIKPAALLLVSWSLYYIWILSILSRLSLRHGCRSGWGWNSSIHPFANSRLT